MSGLEIQYEKESDVEMYDPKERLALTEDDRLVPEGDPDARWLFAVPGRPIPLADAIKYGLVAESEREVPAEPAESKPAKKPIVRRWKS